MSYWPEIKSCVFHLLPILKTENKINTYKIVMIIKTINKVFKI